MGLTGTPGGVIKGGGALPTPGTVGTPLPGDINRPGVKDPMSVPANTKDDGKGKGKDEKPKPKKGNKPFPPDAGALVELARQAKELGGVTREVAELLLQWARELGLKALDHINKDHWKGGPHIHIGPVNHIPVR